MVGQKNLDPCIETIHFNTSVSMRNSQSAGKTDLNRTARYVSRPTGVDRLLSMHRHQAMIMIRTTTSYIDDRILNDEIARGNAQWKNSAQHRNLP
ncbi:hypothetical protein [Paraburkholderia sp. SIMBA_030]|uniref:hypothetical protein n=1 Tax=Paraburkholderia sp. SIMBA_030 TaxID=3085773 RepID=UPI003979CAFD